MLDYLNSLEALAIKEFQEAIPDGCGMIIVDIIGNSLKQYGNIIKINARIELDVVLDRYCIDALICYGQKAVFVLYRRNNILVFEKYEGEPIFEKIMEAK